MKNKLRKQMYPEGVWGGPDCATKLEKRVVPKAPHICSFVLRDLASRPPQDTVFAQSEYFVIIRNVPRDGQLQPSMIEGTWPSGPSLSTPQGMRAKKNIL